MNYSSYDYQDDHPEEEMEKHHSLRERLQFRGLTERQVAREISRYVRRRNASFKF